MASFMDNLREKVKSNPKTIVLAEGYDERHVKAAVILKKEQLVKGVVLVGDTAKIEALAKENALELDGNFAKIFDPNKDAKTEGYIEMLFKAREKKGMTKDQAKELIVNNSVYTGAAILASNEADGMVGGAVYATGEMLRAALFLIGLKKGIKYTFIIALVFSVILYSISMGAPEIYAYIFSANDEVRILIEKYMPLFLMGTIMFSIQMTLQNINVALGQGKTAIILAVFRKVILLIPLCFLLTYVVGFEGTYMSEGIADFIAGFITGIVIFITFPRVIKKRENELKLNKENNNLTNSNI